MVTKSNGLTELLAEIEALKFEDAVQTEVERRLAEKAAIEAAEPERTKAIPRRGASVQVAGRQITASTASMQRGFPIHLIPGRARA
jgi:hypothetical protein